MAALTPEELRAHASDIIIDHATDVEFLSISEHLADDGESNLTEAEQDDAAKAIDELIGRANIKVSWPVETPKATVIAEVILERHAQDAKWGEQNHPDGTGPDVEWPLAAEYADYAARLARDAVEWAAGQGRLTWLDIMLEEVAEAFAESDPAKLRAELVQVAAVAVAWVEAIDRRAT